MPQKLSETVFVRALRAIDEERASGNQMQMCWLAGILDRKAMGGEWVPFLNDAGRELLARCQDAPKAVRFTSGCSEWRLATVACVDINGVDLLARITLAGKDWWQIVVPAELRALAAVCNAAAAELEEREVTRDDQG